jgi:uncharacterized protein YbjT (DUF2867 family)
MYVITGATGNTGSVIARALLAKGQKVRTIARHADRLQALAALGAEPFACEVTDAAALTKAFTGATAVYAMIPPNLQSQDFRAWQDRVSDTIATAVERAGVTRAVTLSSIGADKPEGTGPVAGLYRLEQKLNRISALNVLHLRAGYFMENTLAQIGVIRAMGIMAGPLRPDLDVAMIATRDIGTAAADALLKLNFSGRQERELLGQRDLSMSEAATIVGKAIGRPELTYGIAPDRQLRQALAQLGLSEDMVKLLLEMSAAMNSGHMRPLEPRSPQNTTPTSYETFVAEEFLPRYRGVSSTA